MSNIKYDVEALRDKVKALETEYKKWKKTKRPELSGEGRTVSNMEELADLYDGMYDALVSLAADTATCLGNMADCIESVDEQSAEAFSNDKDYSEGED